MSNDDNDKLYRECVQCGNNFYIKKKDQDYLLGRKLELPKRCFACRKKNKEEAERQLSQATEKDPAKWDQVWNDEKRKKD